MDVRKISEDKSSLTLGWDPVPGVDGYRFWSAGVLRSRTCDPKRSSVKFSKGQEPYVVEAVVFTGQDSGSYPPNAPPPVQTYVKVAPRVAYKTDRGDARYCMFNPDGSLRDGIYRDADGFYHDEVARYARDGDGLEESGVRSPGSAADCPTSASNIDGRAYCSLPMQGDPTKNTGSWTI
jgi:hypothetical protein